MARGFGTTLGSASTDAITSTLTTHASTRSYAIWTYRNDAGGGGFGRMWDKRTGAEAETDTFLNIDASTVYNLTRVFSGGQNTWTIAQPSGGAWVHIVVTLDASSVSNDPVIYVNGASVAVTNTARGTGTANTNASGYVLGNRTTDSARNWDGSLAEFAVWDAILDASEAAALGKGYSPALIRPQSLVEYVPLLRNNVSHKRAAPTITGTAVQPHPRVFYPNGLVKLGVPAAAAPPGTTMPIFYHHYAQQRGL